MSSRAWIVLALVVAAATVGSATAHPVGSKDEIRVQRIAHGVKRPCPPLKVIARDVYGGCKVDVAGDGVVFTLISVFGDHPFAECQLRMTLTLGPTGALFVDDVEVVRVGGTEPSPCGDLRQCESDITDPTSEFPWHGRVVEIENDVAILHVDACFDSCVGRLRGVTRVALHVAGEGSRNARLVMRRSTVGYAGLEITGDVKARSRAGALQIES